jgi:4-amino-4-deoxy-L-arabinose transferase-like glycosyltransferase
VTATNVAPATRRFGALLLLIAVLGLAGRVVYVLAVTRHQEYPPPIGQGTPPSRSFDEIYYVNGADAIVSGEGFKFAQLPGNPRALWEEQGEHPPITSALFVPSRALFDDGQTAMRLTVALAGGLLIVVVGLLGRELAGDRAGLMAAGIAALYPGLWVTDGLLLSETFATLFTTLAVLATYRVLRRASWVMAAAVGVATACAMLARSELALLVPLLAVAIAWPSAVTALRRRLQLAGVTILVAGIVVAPWIVYNLTRFEEPVTLSFSAGGAVDGANCDSTYSGDLLGFWNGLCRPKPEGDGSEIAAERLERGIDYMTDHPGRLPVVVAARLGRLLGVYRTSQVVDLAEAEGRPRAVSLAGLVVSWALIGFGIAGTVRLVRRKIPVLPVLAPVIVVLVSTALTYGSLRFRTPAEPVLVVLGAIGLDRLMVRFGAPDDAPAAAVTPGAPVPVGP